MSQEGEATLQGGCYCRAILYRIVGPTYHETNCHCSICRRTTGAPFVSWFSVRRREFSFTQGEPARFFSTPKASRTFCPDCGTQLTFEHQDFPDEIDITICSLDTPDRVPPNDHTHANSKIKWIELADGLTEYPQARPDLGTSYEPSIRRAASPPSLNTRHHARLLLFGSIALVALLALSGVRPYDRTTWALEVFPVAITLPILWATRHRFPLSTLLYVCIFVHALVLMLGGAYTYARVPLGFQLADLLGLERNPYDKVGHFFQGFVPALAAREILIRGERIRGARMLAFLVICTVLAVSAAYELIEWAAALALGQGADEFLGTQGDPWDTQSDIFCALVGAVTALLAFSGIHDRQLRRLRADLSR